MHTKVAIVSVVLAIAIASVAHSAGTGQASGRRAIAPPPEFGDALAGFRLRHPDGPEAVPHP